MTRRANDGECFEFDELSPVVRNLKNIGNLKEFGFIKVNILLLNLFIDMIIISSNIDNSVFMT